MCKVYITSKVLVLALLALSTTVAWSQPHTLTLDDCRAMALDASYALRSSDERLAASQDLLVAYRANRLPNFSLTGGYLYSTLSFSESIEGGYLPTFTPDLTTGALTPNIAGYGADGTPIFSSYAYMPDMQFDLEVGSVVSAGLQATQPIYMGGKVTAATKLAKVGVAVAEIEQRRDEADVLLSVDEAFYAYLKVGEMLASADAYCAVVEEFRREVESLLASGMCTKNDLLKVQVRLNEAELQRLRARNAQILARMNLCYLIGLPISTLELAVVDGFDLRQRVDEALDVTARPEYELLAKGVEARELEVKLSQGDYLPQVSLLASYSYANGLSLNGTRLLGSSPSFTGGLVVNVPIFHWGAGRRKVSAARREVAVAENTKSDLEQKMTLELMRAINAYNESMAQVSLTERAVEQAEENLRQSRRHYTEGMESLTYLLEAQALWQKAMCDLVEAKATQRLAYAAYRRCRG